MDSQSKVTFRMPEVFRTQYQKLLDENGGSDAKVLFNILSDFFNPKTKIDSTEGTPLMLSDSLFKAIEEMRNNIMPFNDYGTYLLWSQINYNKKYQKGAFTPKTDAAYNGSKENAIRRDEASQFAQPTVSGEDSYAVFQEYQERRRDEFCSAEDWKEIRKEIESDTRLNAKQKRILLA